jgi:hypothetical protein
MQILPTLIIGRSLGSRDANVSKILPINIQSIYVIGGHGGMFVWVVVAVKKFFSQMAFCSQLGQLNQHGSSVGELVYYEQLSKVRLLHKMAKLNVEKSFTFWCWQK